MMWWIWMLIIFYLGVLSSMMWMLSTQAGVVFFSYFSAFCAEIQTQFHVSVQTMRSDNAKEYLSKPFQSFMLENGILHQT